MKCKNCGFEFDEGIFCPECGTKYEEDIVEEATEEVVEEVNTENVTEKQQKETNTEEASKDEKKKRKKEKADAKANKAGRWVIYAIIIAVGMTYATDYLPDLPYGLLKTYEYITNILPMLLIWGAFFIAKGALKGGTEHKGRCILIMSFAIVLSLWLVKISIDDARKEKKDTTFEQNIQNSENVTTQMDQLPETEDDDNSVDVDIDENTDGVVPDYLCDLASLYYGMRNDCQAVAEIDSVDGNIVVISIYEVINDKFEQRDRYYIDKTTEVGYSSSGEEIRLTEVERYLEDTEESISEYSNDDICNMCSKYYFSVYGEEPPYAVVENEAGDKITVHLCEAIDEDTGYGFMSWAFYTIDRNTLSGYNDVSGEEIDLTPFAQ